MLISLSAVSLDKYEWYRYHGKRPKTFDSHNKHHELEIQTKDRFGVRKYGTKFKVVDLTDPSVVFTLEKKEVQTLIKRSKGYKGTLRGTKLTPGVGGLDGQRKAKAPKPSATKTRIARKRRVHVPEGDEPIRDPKYFPELPMPPKKADVQRLYNYFNKLHFNSECPSKIRILFSEALRFSGQAHTKQAGGHVLFTLKLSKRALTDPLRVIDILLHEMIHLHHHSKVFVDGDDRYAGAGHGPLFVQEMERLNKYGYNINIKEDDVKEATLAEPEYVMLVELQNGRWVVIHHPEPFKEQIPEIIDDLRARVSSAVVPTRFIYGKSSSSYSYMGNKLTAKKKLQGKRSIFGFKDSEKVTQALKRDIRVLYEESLKRQLGDVRGSVENAVDSAVRYLEERFSIYSTVVLAEAGLLAEGKKVRNIIKNPLEFVTQDEYDFMEKTWIEAEDRHFLKGETFKLVRKDILKLRLDGLDAVKFLVGVYRKGLETGEYKNRVSITRFSELCVEGFGDIITLPDAELRSEIVEMAKV